MACAVLTPKVLLPPVWPPPLSLAATRGISFDFSSSGYLDVSLPRVPRVRLCVQRTLRDSSSRVFPHSDISGSKLICSSPKLFAACHVLRRLPMPRHSPCALSRLNSSCIYLIQLVLLLELLCFTFTVTQFLYFFASGKIVLLYPPERPDFFNQSRLFPLLLNFVCSCAVIHTSVCITPLLSYSVFNELSPAL